MYSNLFLISLVCTVNSVVQSLYMFGSPPPPPPIWDKVSSGLKKRSRDWFIGRAERAGIPWQAVTDIYKDTGIFYKCVHHKNNIENRELRYPSYFTKQFHGYDKGNMNWQAAFEAEAATLSISANYWKGSDPFTSEQWLRNNITDRIITYRNLHDIIEPPTHILDIGCSIGVSTEFLKSNFKDAHVWGLDLSPYFLAVAAFRTERFNRNINYVHANAEKIPFSDNSMDIVTMNFLLHEVPTEPTINMLNEVMRVLKPGGTLHIVDLEPTQLKSTLSASPFRKWAFEVTEPHIYEYYKNSMTETLISCGFHNIVKYKNDPLNSMWCAIKKDNQEYFLSTVTEEPSSNTHILVSQSM